MLFFQEPADFLNRLNVVGCFITCKDEILLIKRAPHKLHGNTWGVPAGKVEKGEDLDIAMCREIYEETGIKLNSSDIKYFNSYFVRYPSYDFKYHVYSTPLVVKPVIKIDNKSHTEYCWKKPKDALKLELIPDEDSCIKLFFNRI